MAKDYDIENKKIVRNGLSWNQTKFEWKQSVHWLRGVRLTWLLIQWIKNCIDPVSQTFHIMSRKGNPRTAKLEDCCLTNGLFVFFFLMENFSSILPAVWNNLCSPCYEMTTMLSLLWPESRRSARGHLQLWKALKQHVFYQGRVRKKQFLSCMKYSCLASCEIPSG